MTICIYCSVFNLLFHLRVLVRYLARVGILQVLLLAIFFTSLFSHFPVTIRPAVTAQEFSCVRTISLLYFCFKISSKHWERFSVGIMTN